MPTGGLTKKIQFVNEGNFDFALEIHLNADSDEDNPGDPVAKGCEVLYNTGSTKGVVFATDIYNELVNSFCFIKRGVKGRDNLAFLNKTNPPACIIEPAFIDSPDVAYLLGQPSEVAEAIARAIQTTLNKF